MGKKEIKLSISKASSNNSAPELEERVLLNRLACIFVIQERLPSTTFDKPSVTSVDVTKGFNHAKCMALKTIVNLKTDVLVSGGSLVARSYSLCYAQEYLKLRIGRPLSDGVLCVVGGYSDGTLLKARRGNFGTIVGERFRRVVIQVKSEGIGVDGSVNSGKRDPRPCTWERGGGVSSQRECDRGSVYRKNGSVMNVGVRGYGIVILTEVDWGICDCCFGSLRRKAVYEQLGVRNLTSKEVAIGRGNAQFPSFVSRDAEIYTAIQAFNRSSESACFLSSGKGVVSKKNKTQPQSLEMWYLLEVCGGHVDLLDSCDHSWIPMPVQFKPERCTSPGFVGAGSGISDPFGTAGIGSLTLTHFRIVWSPVSSILEPWHDLRGKVVMVTGASSCIGRDFCINLAKAGCEIIAAARRVDRLKSLCDEINGQDHTSNYEVRAVAVELDVSAISSVIVGSVFFLNGKDEIY
ncbi:3-oxoacyl-[acyl-carrier-protein] reductase FabG [Artemisia annua]|uniref:3-oxoacyl-[acyl-carrier-protein] reductase FabG n=1 Tax=Artemisia annua TaxID=35608 RepID=A0A2U1P9P9_ARTAN|nr:3-oxoacyl-[acyl-carrier-protein] reductase FabG [Artemisia annua]